MIFFYYFLSTFYSVMAVVEAPCALKQLKHFILNPKSSKKTRLLTEPFIVNASLQWLMVAVDDFF